VFSAAGNSWIGWASSSGDEDILRLDNLWNFILAGELDFVRGDETGKLIVVFDLLIIELLPVPEVE
jgi:hypothetical protein